MAESQRTVQKVLACQEDLNFGEGAFTQTRGDGQFSVSKIRGFYPCNSQEELDNLDPLRFPKAVLVGTDKLRFYSYSNGAYRPLVTPTQTFTLAEAVANSSAAEGDTVIVSDRGNGLFEYKAGQTPNGYNIIACTGAPSLSLVLVNKNKNVSVLKFGVVSGSGQEAAIQAAIDYAHATGRTGKKKKRVVLDDSLDLTIVDVITLKQGVDFDDRGATVTSTDLTNEDILICDGDNVVNIDGDWYGGDNATLAGFRKVRAIHINKNLTAASNVTIKGDGSFNNFYITSIYCSGNRDNIPRKIKISGTAHHGSNKQLQAITVFCGAEVYVDKNTIYDMDSVPILVDEATNSTPMDNYGVLKRVHITNNIILFDAPTNTSVLYGIQATACEVSDISGNTISGLPTSARGIVATLYDLAQQKNRIENFSETGPFLPIDETNARLSIKNNTIVGGGVGIYVGGYTAPNISGNNVVASVPVELFKVSATIDSTAYTFPSTDNTGATEANMEALVEANVLISTDASSEVVKISSSRNYFLDNVFKGVFSQRYAAENNLSTHVVRDADQSMGVSGTLLAGSRVSGAKTFVGGEGATTISLVEGTSNILTRGLGYAPDDYLVVPVTSWNSGAYIPDTVKTLNSFQVNFPTAAPAGGVLWWFILNSESFRPS